MPDNKNSQNQDDKIKKQDQQFSGQKSQVPTEMKKSDLADKEDDDGDEDENHYDDSIKKEKS